VANNASASDPGDARMPMIAARARPLERGVGGRRRKWATVLLGGVLFLALLTQVSWSDLSSALAGARVDLAGAAVVIGLVATVIRAARFNYFFRSRGRLVELYGVFALLRLINYVLPFRSGEVAALFLLKKRNLSPTVAETSPVWVLLRVADVAALLTLLAAMLNVGVSAYATEGTVVWVTALLAALSILLLALAPKLLGLLFARYHDNASGRWLASRLSSVAAGLGRFQGKMAVVWALVPAMLLWLVNIGVAVLSLYALNAPLTFVEAATASTAVLTLNLLPIRAPLGIGTGEAAWAGVLVVFGTPLSMAIALAIGVRLIQMLLVGVDGLLGMGISVAHRAMR
jgi:uncharacterized membrane protein YbhN (UPF0104 family)